MGRVYRGFDTRLQRPVALKTVRVSLALTEESRQRFVQEARVLSRLNHPNICQVYDFLEDGPVALLVLELIEGRTLGAAMKEGLGEAEKLRIALAVVEAVTAAHREQIVHRDLKPDNVMIGIDGVVKVLDFGLAQPSSALGTLRSVAPYDLSLAQVEDPDRTAAEPVKVRAPREGKEPSDRERTAVGTLAYMSPEQARLEPISMASDIYSVGVLLQELFTERRAFATVPGEELLERVRSGRTEPLEGVDPALAALIEDLLQQDPSQRPEAEEVGLRLRAFRDRPKHLRRRRLKLAIAGLTVALVVMTTGTAILSRVQARRQALLAQQFTAEANDMESALRMAYLAPVHDLRPTLTAVRERMDGLKKEMERRRSLGRGPGTYALGRVALALDDVETAREYFEAAWKSNYRTPQVASGLGVATFELYRRQLSTLERSGPLPEQELDRLHKRLRDPSLGYLGLGRQALEAASTQHLQESLSRFRRPMESLEYVEALRAFQEERFEEALSFASASVAGAPLFFEGQLLRGKIFRAQGDRLQGNADYAGAVTAYDAASAALREAAAVGRSSPGVFLERCEVALSRMILELYLGTSGDLESSFEAGSKSCGTVLEIDGDHAVALYRLSELHLRAAEGAGETAEGREHLKVSERLLARSLALNREDGEAWKLRGHLEMLQSDWRITYGRFDTEEVASRVRKAQEAYAQAQRLRPEDYRVLNSLANSYAMESELAVRLGEDPRPSLARAMEGYRQAIERAPSLTMMRSNLLLALADQADFEARTGRDFESTLRVAKDEYGELLEIAARGGHHNGFRAFARACNAAVLGSLLEGKDPQPWIVAALSALETLGESEEKDFLELREKVRALLLRGKVAASLGEDPRPSLMEARESLITTLREIDDPVMRELLARTYSQEARWLFSSGEDPKTALGKARSILDGLVAAMEAVPEALAERARLNLISARYRALRGGLPGPVLRAAREDLQQALDLGSGQLDTSLAAADVERWTLALGLEKEGDRERHLKAGRRHLKRVRSIYPDLAEATALEAVFVRLAGGHARDSPTRRSSLEAADRQLREALRSNPFLRRNYADEVRLMAVALAQEAP